jgi:hypothetical protein
MIWYHIPLRLSSRLHEEPIGARRSEAEMKRVMHEKKMALDLVEGFVCSSFTYMVLTATVDLLWRSNIISVMSKVFIMRISTIS